jgi:Holliday junction resolvase
VESPEQKRLIFFEIKKRPKEALFMIRKIAGFVRICNGKPEIASKKENRNVDNF